MRHPSRYRPMGSVTTTETQESGTDQRSGRERSTVASSEFSATLGTIASRLRSGFRRENRRTQAQSTHASTIQTSEHTQEYKFTGFENTAIVLAHLCNHLGLMSPAELARESSEGGLDNRLRWMRNAHPGRKGGPTEDTTMFYHDLRVTSVRLAQMAGLLLAQDQQLTGDAYTTFSVEAMARQGYVAEPLTDMIDMGPMD